MATTWEGIEFVLKRSIAGTEVDVKKSPAKNRFKFEELRDTSGNIYQYKLKPKNPNDMKKPWSNCSKLLPQDGAPLTWFLPAGKKLDPAQFPSPKEFQKAVNALTDEIVNQKINTVTPYERLVGTIEAIQADNPIAFYQVPNLFVNPKKVLVIARINLINAGAPVGTLAADN